ncbi:MAG TPA: hypothetical protein PLL20_17820 [Phycisphaerae bacterium]|nr:hypothetical protein [Phycisphaerae bacterium]HRR86749.1 hypothetical protein [Phycisphaerae bacterium]
MRDPSNNRVGQARQALSRVLVLGVGLATVTGCGPEFGAVIYHLGVGAEQKVRAEFKLPAGPVLILVDDEMDLVSPPSTRETLVDELATRLKEHKVVERVTTNEELALIRRSAADFDELSVREVGRRANADTVIWMNVEDFYVDRDLEMMVAPARFGVKLKVFNAREEDRLKIRLWPPERDGRRIDITISPHEARRCKSRSELDRLLASTMADEVAKLFYDHKVETR